MKLRKCSYCKIYTLEKICSKCKKLTTDAHYKFLKDKTQSDSNSFPSSLKK